MTIHDPGRPDGRRSLPPARPGPARTNPASARRSRGREVAESVLEPQDLSRLRFRALSRSSGNDHLDRLEAAFVLENSVDIRRRVVIEGRPPAQRQDQADFAAASPSFVDPDSTSSDREAPHGNTIRHHLNRQRRSSRVESADRDGMLVARAPTAAGSNDQPKLSQHMLVQSCSLGKADVRTQCEVHAHPGDTTNLQSTLANCACTTHRS